MELNPIRKPPVVAPSRDFFLDMALLALLLMIISSTCQAFGVPFASRCRAPAAAATFAGSSIVIRAKVSAGMNVAGRGQQPGRRQKEETSATEEGPTAGWARKRAGKTSAKHNLS